MIADHIHSIQEALADASLDGWLFTCFQKNDPVSLSFLGLDREGLLVTRRCYYLIPRQGAPRKLVHGLEPEMLAHLPGNEEKYTTWQEHAKGLSDLMVGIEKLAAQYSPNNALPSVSRLDAGTAELLRSAGVELVTSADLVQRFAAVWTEEQLAMHHRASEAIHEIVLQAFAHAGEALRAEREIREYEVQQFILERFGERGLWTESSPIVAVDAHAADPHYQPSAEASAVISPGCFLLIDLWAKEKAEASIYADITWCGVCADRPEDRHARVFGVAAEARDAALRTVTSRYPHDTVRGFEVDDAARNVINEAGFGEWFIHRTGHSIDTADHGQGANMDNLETHDVRPLIAMTGFSIEPGIYLPGDFGVRTEINVALEPDRAVVSGAEPQRELIRLLG